MSRAIIAVTRELQAEMFASDRRAIGTALDALRDTADWTYPYMGGS